MKPLARCLPILLLALLLPSAASAAGFAISEQSAKASALGGAFVARADDAAANWYNPAALVWLEGSELQFGANVVDAGSDTELTVLDPSFGVFSPTTFDMKSNFATPIHLYYRHRVNPNFAWGIGINTPFGLVTEWVDRPITFSAAKSELETFLINPNLAFRLTRSWSVGVGLQYILADITEFSREVPVDLDGNPLNGFEVIGRSNLTGDGDDLGFNVALHHKSPSGFTFGLTYRYDLTAEIEGNLDLTGFGPLQPFFVSSPGTAPLELPDSAAIGLGWERARWHFEIDAVWVGWSVFDVLRVDVANETPFVQDIALREDWDDSTSLRLGVAFKNRAGTSEWRFGLILEEGAVPEDTLRPSIPDADRLAPAIGWGRDGKRWGIDLYATTFFFDEIAAVGPDEGVIAGEFSSTATLAGATFRVGF